MAKGNGKTTRVFGGYRFYNFVRNKDPKIDEVRTITQDEGFYGKKGGLNRLSLLTGVSVSTYLGWFEGETRMPKSATMGATLAALGYKMVIQKDRDSHIDRERAIAKAAKELAKHREEMRKKANRAGRKTNAT